jgi:hypothetical protein
MSDIKILKGEATIEEIAAIEKALAKRQLVLSQDNSYRKVENNS